MKKVWTFTPDFSLFLRKKEKIDYSNIKIS
jgi:hypothetical protein